MIYREDVILGRDMPILSDLVNTNVYTDDDVNVTNCEVERAFPVVTRA